MNLGESLTCSALLPSTVTVVVAFREAAREYRRKKKEYVRYLENRVVMLENLNKALIEEIRSLKDVYQQNME